MIKVLFFGPVADRIQTREMSFEATPGITVSDIIARIAAQHPGALDMVSFIAVNQEQVQDRQTLLRDGDEVALMAKFSGG